VNGLTLLIVGAGAALAIGVGVAAASANATRVSLGKGTAIPSDDGLCPRGFTLDPEHAGWCVPTLPAVRTAAAANPRPRPTRIFTPRRLEQTPTAGCAQCRQPPRTEPPLASQMRTQRVLLYPSRLYSV
jgi:hypothetical protein